MSFNFNVCIVRLHPITGDEQETPVIVTGTNYGAEPPNHDYQAAPVYVEIESVTDADGRDWIDELTEDEIAELEGEAWDQRAESMRPQH